MNQISKAQRILFVIPAYSMYPRGRYVMPLGILYVSAAAKSAGLDVCCLNLNHETGDPGKALSRKIEETGCTIVAVGGLSGEFKDLYAVLRHVRRHYPEITTVVGGGIITATPEVAMQALEFADIGIIGEGDETIVELVKALENHTPLDEVDGIVHKQGETWVQTARRRDVQNLDALPLPDYDGFEFAHYLATNNLGYGNQGEPLSPVNIVGSRSCPYMCSFCFHPSGRTYRERSLDSVFLEIDYLLEKYPGINHIAMREELFASRPERISEFCRRIADYKLYWSIQLRVDNVSESVLRDLSTAGCFAVFIGTESMDDTVLKSMNKRVTSEQSCQALQQAARSGVPIRTGLIFGDKAETQESYRRTLSWYRQQDSYSEIQKRPLITVDMLVPFPGSAIYRYACRKGIIPDEVEYLRMGCPLVNLTDMPEDDFLDMMRCVQAINGRSYQYLSGNALREISPPSCCEIIQR